jgi:hypothetical protein
MATAQHQFDASSCCGTSETLRRVRPRGGAKSLGLVGPPSPPRGIMADKEQAMGDKGGKKDKETT